MADTRPTDFDPATLDGQHTLVLRALSLGKSHRFRERERNSPVPRRHAGDR
ncbi:MAG: hypothetical protein J07HX64_01376 [halophilic archaeon J07HX64]|nr:MAG: hypothetical protein J07HX64_01376 [halophilic archaeon J07HX64]